MFAKTILAGLVLAVTAAAADAQSLAIGYPPSASATLPTFVCSGTCSQPGLALTVTLKIPGRADLVETTTVDQQGNWSVNFNTMLNSTVVGCQITAEATGCPLVNATNSNITISATAPPTGGTGGGMG